MSAVLITRDAQAHLSQCLASVAWCDEIVVVDGGSTDATPAICAEAGARLFTETDWRGFGVQKNRALARAAGDWAFSIDADEVCTPALRAQIESQLAAPGAAVALEMPRRSSFCGHWMRHGGWWPDRVTRVFRRDRARFSDDLVHERLIVDGAVARLTEPLLHYTYDTLEQALAKLDRYSTLGARQAHARGKRATPAGAVLRGAWAFFRTYVLRLGLLDGWAGVMLALYNAQGTYYRYMKLWLLGRGEPPGPPPA
ncbi:MAG: glycosyltransferase family 2 protein [Nevskia sp.]|nr:glycosyltransferase family 2 protein [Nevskia sp.]